MIIITMYRGGMILTKHIEEMACLLAVYMLETGSTVRKTAQKFGISKSTVHKYLTERLPHCNEALYESVRKLMDYNKAQRHLRGGMATREKYIRLNQSRDKSFCKGNTK